MNIDWKDGRAGGGGGSFSFALTKACVMPAVSGGELRAGGVGGDARRFFQMARKPRGRPADETLSIASIDVGGGTTDLIINSYRLEGAGTSVTLLAREGTYAQLRLRSGEVRRIHIDCRATIGEVSNEEHSLRQYGKAGAIRWKGIRPTVRGVAMNPVDHPHGGGEGRTGEGQVPVSPWNTMTKGYRTRNNKRTQTFIVSRRKK